MLHYGRIDKRISAILERAGIEYAYELEPLAGQKLIRIRTDQSTLWRNYEAWIGRFHVVVSISKRKTESRQSKAS